MGLIVNALNKIALSKKGQQFYKWANSPKGQDFLVKKLPPLETATAGIFYVASTYYQYKKGNLDERRHRLLQWQNILSSVCGVTLSAWLSKKSTDYINNKVIPDLKPDLMEDAHKVKIGLQVALPILLTAIAVRSIIPACLAWYSGKLEEKRAEKAKLNKLA